MTLSTTKNRKNPILDMLIPGDLRMKGNSEKVVERILTNTRELDLLIACLSEDVEAMRMRCCDAMEKISRSHPQWFNRYKSRLLKVAKQEKQKEVRWHLAQIIPRLSLTAGQKYTAYTTFQTYLNDKSSIVKTFAMQALVDLAQQDNSLINETRKTIQVLTKTGTPAMQSRGRQLLKTLL